MVAHLPTAQKMRAFFEAWLAQNDGAPMTTSQLVPLAVEHGVLYTKGLDPKGLSVSLGRVMRAALTEYRLRLPYDLVERRGRSEGRFLTLYRRDGPSAPDDDDVTDEVPRHMKPFVRWLLTQGDRNDLVGDLATDARRDRSFPTNGSITQIRAYLSRYPDYVREAFEVARNDYTAYRRVSVKR